MLRLRHRDREAIGCVCGEISVLRKMSAQHASERDEDCAAWKVGAMPGQEDLH